MASNGEIALSVFHEVFNGPKGEPWRGIQSQEIRDFTVECFDKLCPDSFWERPASRSGKYHPKISEGTGGLVRHVKLACWLGVELCRAMDEYPSDQTPYSSKVHTVHQDEVLSALLLHDVLKDGDPALDHQRGVKRDPDGSISGAKSNGFWKGKIGGCHGIDMCNAISTKVITDPASIQPWQVRICLAVASHMGNWTKSIDRNATADDDIKYRPASIKNEETRLVATIVSTADYVASRKIDGCVNQIMSEPVPSLLVEQESESEDTEATTNRRAA